MGASQPQLVAVRFPVRILFGFLYSKSVSSSSKWIQMDEYRKIMNESEPLGLIGYNGK